MEQPVGEGYAKNRLFKWRRPKEPSSNIPQTEATVQAPIVEAAQEPHAEHVAKEVTDASIDRIAQFYSLPPHLVEQAKTVEAFVVNDAQMLKEREANLRYRFEQQLKLIIVSQLQPENQNDKELNELKKAVEWVLSSKKNLQENAQSTGGKDGIFLPFQDGRTRILISDRLNPERFLQTLDHEQFHNLASKGLARGFAHIDQKTGLTKMTPADEGITELLRISMNNPHASMPDIYRNIPSLMENGGISYAGAVDWLAQHVAATHYEGGSPITARDVAKHYFKRATGEATETQNTYFPFIEEVTNRTAPAHRISNRPARFHRVINSSVGRIAKRVTVPFKK